DGRHGLPTFVLSDHFPGHLALELQLKIGDFFMLPFRFFLREYNFSFMVSFPVRIYIVKTGVLVLLLIRISFITSVAGWSVRGLLCLLRSCAIKILLPE